MAYKSDSVVKNQVFNLSIQILNILIMLITIPYITRLFGPTILGKINFASSIVQYFVMFAMAGIPVYATREIARYRDNDFMLRKKLKEITLLQCIFSILSMLLYIIIVFITARFRKDIYIYLFLGIQIISNSLNFVWFIQGLEKYRYTAITSLGCRLINLILIFALLKSKSSYNTYALITGITYFFNNFLSLIISAFLLRDFKKDKKIEINFKDLKVHVYCIAIFFIVDIAGQVHTVIDQTMLGILDTDASVGYYAMSVKLTNVILSVISSIIIVMIPRISNKVQNQNLKDIKKYIITSIRLVYILAIPAIFGILAIGEEIVTLYLGVEYTQSIRIFKIISILLIIISLSNIFYLQVMIPYGKEKRFTIILIFATVLNFILNLFLIPKYSYFGAVAATIITESLVTAILYVEVKKIIGRIDGILRIGKIVIPSFIFYLFIKIFIKSFVTSSVLVILVSIPTAAIIYVIGLILLKEEISMYVLEKIKGFKRIKKN